jgi:hypothetical protein
MTSRRALAASRQRSQAATRLLIAVRRAERPESTPEDASARSALDHTIARPDADLRRLETAAARMAPMRKVRT